MARQGLMDDSGYHGFDECNCYEDCTNEAYEQGYADALNKAIEIAMERTPQIIYSVELERLKENK